MSSTWIAQNPHAKVPDYLGFPGPVGCIENKEFVDWITNFMGTVIRDYPVDGIIWDEPKDEALISRHPDTLAKFGPEPTEQQMEVAIPEYRENLDAYLQEYRPDHLSLYYYAHNNEDPETVQPIFSRW